MTLRSQKIWVLLFCAMLASSPAFSDSGKGDYYRGLDLYHAGDYDGAIQAFQAQLNLTPDDASVKQWLDLARQRASQNTAPGALPSKSPETRPSAPPSLLQESPVQAPAPAAPAPVVSAPVQSPKPADADGQSQDDYERGISLYLSGSYEESLAAFNRYLQANPGHIATQQWITLVKALVPGAEAEAGKKKLPTEDVSPTPVRPAPVQANAFKAPAAPAPAPAKPAAPVPAAAPAVPQAREIPAFKAPEEQRPAAVAARPPVPAARTAVTERSDWDSPPVAAVEAAPDTRSLPKRIDRLSEIRPLLDTTPTASQEEKIQKPYPVAAPAAGAPNARPGSGVNTDNAGIASLRESNETLRREVDNKEKEIERLRADLKTNEDLAQRAIAQTKKALTLSEGGPQQKNTSRASSSDFEEENRRLRADKDRLVAELNSQKKTLSDLQNSFDKSQNEIERLRKENERTRSQAASSSSSASAGRAGSIQARLDDREIALRDLSKNYQSAEDARNAAERKLSQADEQIHRLQDRVTRLQQEVERVGYNPEIKANRLALQEARQALADSERMVKQLTAQYRLAEEGRVSAEKRLYDLADKQNDRGSQVQQLRSETKRLSDELASKDSAARGAEQEAARAQELLDESRAEASRLAADLKNEKRRADETAKAQQLLEESRTEASRLASDLENQRLIISNLQARLAQGAEHERDTRSQLENLRHQLDGALSQYDESKPADNSDSGTSTGRSRGTNYQFQPSGR